MLTRLCAAAFLAGLCAAHPSLAQQASPISEADAKQAASAISKAWDDAYNAGNPTAIAALFAPGGVYLTPGGTMLKDRQEMATSLAARLKAGWTKETIKVIEAHPIGDHVSSVVEYTILGAGRSAGKQISGYGAELLTRSGSEWRIELIAANLTPAQNLIEDVTGMASAVNGCPGPC